MLGQCSACAADRPTSARFEPARRFRGFHHWFTRRCTVLPCLPDPARLAVPDRPVVVGAAPTLPGASQVRLPPASTGLLRQPRGGSFHPTRSHGASWRTPLSPWTLTGRVRRRPAGVRTGGMSSTIAWNMVVSLTLAAVTTAVSGSPPPSQTRWSLLPGLPRSTGFAPTWSPALGPHTHGVHARPRPVQPAALAQAVQDLQVELIEDPGVGPLGEPAPTGRRRAAAQLSGGQQPPGGGGAGHEHDRGQAGPVGDGAMSATVGRARWGRQQGRHQRPQLVRYEVVSKGCHGCGSCQTNPKGAKRRLSAVQAASPVARVPLITSAQPLLVRDYLEERPE
jgi:hypothetical protein